MFIGFLPGVLLAALSYLHNVNQIEQAPKSQDTISVLSTITKQNTASQAKKPIGQADINVKTKKKTSHRRAKKPTDDSDVEFTFFTELKKHEEIVSEKDVENESKKVSRQQKTKHKLHPVPKRNSVRDKTKHEKPSASRKPNPHKAITNAAPSKSTVTPKKKEIHKDKLVKNAKTKTQQQKTKVKTPKPVSPILDHRYVLQAGSFRTKEHAIKRQDRLSKIGVPSKLEIVKVKGGNWFRISIGPFDRYDLIKKNLTHLRKHKISAITVKLK